MITLVNCCSRLCFTWRMLTDYKVKMTPFKSESSVFGQVCAHKQESEMFVFILLGLSDFSNLFYTTDRSLNQPLTNHRIQHFLQ